MKLKKIPLAALAAVTTSVILGLAGKANAAVTVTWQAPVTIASSNDVSTNGTQVFGRCITVELPTNPSATVNGANFAFNNPLWTVGYTESGFPGNVTDSTVPTLSGPDAANYQTILTYGREAYPTGSFTLSNLSTTQQYELQVWVADYRAYTNVRTETITATGDSASPALTYLNSGGSVHGQYIIGTFTPDTASVTFTMTGNETAMYNAMQLRAIPEPSAAALGLLAAGGLLLRRRRA